MPSKHHNVLIDIAIIIVILWVIAYCIGTFIVGYLNNNVLEDLVLDKSSNVVTMVVRVINPLLASLETSLLDVVGRFLFS